MRMSPAISPFHVHPEVHSSPPLPAALEPIAAQARSDGGVALVRLSPVTGLQYGHKSPPPPLTEMFVPAQARSEPGKSLLMMPLTPRSLATGPALCHTSPMLPVASEQPVPTQVSRCSDPAGSPRCPATPLTPRRNLVPSLCAPLSASRRDASPKASPRTPKGAESIELASVRVRAAYMQPLPGSNVSASSTSRARQPVSYDRDSRRNDGAASCKVPSQAPCYPVTSLSMQTPRSRAEVSTAYGHVYVACGAASTSATATATSAAQCSPSPGPCGAAVPAELDLSYNSPPKHERICHSPSKQLCIQQQLQPPQQQQTQLDIQGHSPLPRFGVRPGNSEATRSCQQTPRSSPAKVLPSTKHFPALQQRTNAGRLPGSVVAPSTIPAQPPSSPTRGALAHPTTPRRQHPTTNGSLSPSPARRAQQAVSPTRTPRPPRVRVASPSPARPETYVAPTCHVNWPCPTPHAAAPSPPRTAWGMVHGDTSLGLLQRNAVRCDGGAGQLWHMTTCAFAGSTDIPITFSPGGRSSASSPSSPRHSIPSPSPFRAPTLEDRLTAMRRACDEAASRLKTQPGLSPSPVRPIPTDITKIEVPSALPLMPPLTPPRARRQAHSASPVRRWQSQPPLPAAILSGGAASARQHSSLDSPQSPRSPRSPLSPRLGLHHSSPSLSQASSPRDAPEDEASPVPSIECYVKADVLRKQLDVIEGKRREGRDAKKKFPQWRRSR